MDCIFLANIFKTLPYGLECENTYSEQLPIKKNKQKNFCFHTCKISGLGESGINYLSRNPEVTLSVMVKTLTTLPRYAAGGSLQQVISHSTTHNTLSTSISQLHCNINLKGHLQSLHSSCTHCRNATTSNGTWQLSKLNIHTQGQGCKAGPRPTLQSRC